MADKIKPQDVLDATGVKNPESLMRAIYNSSSSLFKASVPLPNADNVQAVGAGINKLETVRNEFIATLVERISKVVVKYKSFRNPLAMFKRGTMPLGKTIQEIFVDIAKEHLFDPEQSVTTVFQREIPDVKAMYHEVNRKGFYKATIQESDLEQAFTSWDNFNSFVAGIINSLYSGDEIGEFEYMKLLIGNYYEKGHFHEIPFGEITTSNARSFVQQIKALSNVLEFPSRKYNAQGVTQITAKDDQYIIMDAKTDALVDTEVLASAFNMNKVEFSGHKLVIDQFPDATETTESNILAVIVDSDWYMIYDKLYKATQLYNQEGLYWNHWLHHHQLLSTSQFSNAIAIIKNEVARIPVTAISMTGVTENEITGAVGTTASGTVTFTPSNATNTDGTLRVSDTTIAKVEFDNEDSTTFTVTFLKEGVTTMRYRLSDESVEYTVIIRSTTA